MPTLELNGAIMLQSSKLWDNRYGVFTFLNNPWLYMSLCLVLIDLVDGEGASEIYEHNVLEYFSQCSGGSALLYRWPDRTEIASHDELIGAAITVPGFAIDLLSYLSRRDGEYLVSTETNRFEQKNLYRFPWFISFLKACAAKHDESYRVSLFSQAWYCGHVLAHAMTYKQDRHNDSGTIKIWVMNQVMQRHALCKTAISFWRRRMKREGSNPCRMFSYYLTEAPTFLKYAERFGLNDFYLIGESR